MGATDLDGLQRRDVLGDAVVRRRVLLRELGEAEQRVRERVVRLVERGPERVRWNACGRQRRGGELGERGHGPASPCSLRHWSTLPAIDGESLPASTSASMRRVRGGSLNGRTT